MKARRRLRQVPSLVPILSVLRHYPMHWLGKDTIAGLTACIVMIPSVLAYAELVHLPPITGIYAAIMACVGYAVFSSSRHVIAGPDAAIGLLAGSAILPLAGNDPARIAILAAELAVFSGLILLAASQLKLGIIADLLSRPVLVGYLNGASLVLIATQLGKVFGIRTEGEEVFPLVFTVIERLGETHWPTFWLAILLVGLLVALARWLPRVPAALLVSAVAIASVYFLDLGAQGVSLVGSVEPGLPSIELFKPRWADVAALAPAAVAIAFLAFSDGILLAQTFAEKNSYEVDANQELLALGVANVMASAAQGFPVSASQSRSSVVDALGAKSQVAQLVAAGGLILFLLFLTPLLALMPKAALGAILIVTAFGMLETASLRMLLRIDRSEFAIAVGVTLIILLTGVVPGIIAGLLLSLIEVPVAVLHERLGWSRVRATWAAIVCMAVLGSLCALSFSTLGGVTLIGKNNIFDSFDFASSKILMPLAGLLTSLFVSRHWGKQAFVQANSNHGALGNECLLGAVFWVLSTVSPILIGVIMYFGLMT